MYVVKAYQVATHINLKQLRRKSFGKLLFSDSDELYYSLSKDTFVYIFQYGMVCVFNLREDDVSVVLRRIKPFCSDYLTETISEYITVKIEPDKTVVGYNEICIPKLDEEMVRLVMLNASQSVALERFSEVTERLLIDTNEHTKYLESKGKLDISGVKLKRYIGKTLNLKNKISENLYIFDAPEIAIEDEKLNHFNLQLKRYFDLKDRYKLILERLEIIKENLSLFKDIMDHKESSRLEWIIIILIMVEVVDMFVLKFR